MIASGGVYISQEAAEELISILDLSSRLVDLMEASKHTDNTDDIEVKLLNALDRGATIGLSVEFLQKVLGRYKR